MKKYKVKNVPVNQLIINGKADDTLWNKAVILDCFCSPWENLTKTKTIFKALWDGDYLFFCFQVEDNNIHIDKTDDSINSINVSDRVELFFRPNTSLNPYYCLEIDPTPRIMDFKALPDKNFDFNWIWPKDDLIVKSNVNDKGFTVEGKISINSLINLDLIHNQIIQTGIFRAKYIKAKDSIYNPVWITWVNPKTEFPNFHIPSSFGLLELE